MSRANLLSSPEYWHTNAQNDVWYLLLTESQKRGITVEELAKSVGAPKTALEGDFNGILSRLVEIGINLGYAVEIKFTPLPEVIAADKKWSPRKILSWYSGHGIIWIRVFGYGVVAKDLRVRDLLFSERVLKKGTTIGNYHFRRLRKNDH